jgi:heterodisulfide reductase subunit C
MGSKIKQLLILFVFIPVAFIIASLFEIQMLPAFIIASVFGIYVWICYVILIITKVQYIGERKIKPVAVLLIYFISPLIVTYFYWIVKSPVVIITDKPAFIISSLLGIFAYVWMCFNILIMIKLKFIERNIEIRFLTTFHAAMSSIALFFGAAHGLWYVYLATSNDNQYYTGLVGFVIFIVLMALALVFMSNRLIRSKRILKFRASVYEKKFRYKINKILHNITILGVFVIFVHSLLSYTAIGSEFMTGVYFIFFILTLIGWVSHKIVRRLQIDTDPYIHRKGSWDIFISENLEESDKEWILKIMKENPSLYVCIQCGTCTEGCPVAPMSNGRYNPRLMIEKMLLGQKKMLEGDRDSNMWLCSTCQLCVEQCPQKIELTEIFVSIKNESFEEGYSPEGLRLQAQMIFDHGMSIAYTAPILKRREQLGLSEIKFADSKEVQTLMKEAGLDLSTSKEGIEK